MSFEVFLSFKNSGKDGKATPDAAAARSVYEALKARDMKVFFSEESLAEVGQGQFGKSIERALESAKVLILVASCREHIESPWVEAEWDSFLQTVRSGHKQGELFIFNCGKLNPGDLPLFLRRQQMFSKDSIEKMLQFVSNALPNEPTLEEIVQLSMHCFRPERNEDKIYLVTTHPVGSGSTVHVTAHWGSRSAKRLSSQVKATNVTKEAAAVEVEKASREKLRGGYVPSSLDKLLTSEARTQLAGALGVRADLPAKPKPKAKSAVKPKAESAVAPKTSKPVLVVAAESDSKARPKAKAGSKVAPKTSKPVLGIAAESDSKAEPKAKAGSKVAPKTSKPVLGIAAESDSKAEPKAKAQSKVEPLGAPTVAVVQAAPKAANEVDAKVPKRASKARSEAPPLAEASKNLRAKPASNRAPVKS